MENAHPDPFRQATAHAAQRTLHLAASAAVTLTLLIRHRAQKLHRRGKGQRQRPYALRDQASPARPAADSLAGASVEHGGTTTAKDHRHTSGRHVQSGAAACPDPVRHERERIEADRHQTSADTPALLAAQDAPHPISEGVQWRGGLGGLGESARDARPVTKPHSAARAVGPRR